MRIQVIQTGNQVRLTPSALSARPSPTFDADDNPIDDGPQLLAQQLSELGWPCNILESGNVNVGPMPAPADFSDLEHRTAMVLLRLAEQHVMFHD